MPIYAYPDYREKDLTPSKGRVRAVYHAGKFVGYQDPDVYIERTYPDGRITTYRNPLINREAAIQRLHFDFETNTIRDSLNRTVGVANIAFPAAGTDIVYVHRQVQWMPYSGDISRYVPAPNEEIIERVVFIRSDGEIRMVPTKYGLGKKYDQSKAGGRWRRSASQSLGLPEDVRATTKELQKAVLHKEFLIKKIITLEG